MSNELQSLILLLRLSYVRALSIFDSYFEKQELNIRHYMVVCFIATRKPALSQINIAGTLGFNRTLMVELLDDLEERKLVKRMRNPSDRRAHVITLTPKGKQWFEAITAIADAASVEFLKNISDQEQREFLKILKKLGKDGNGLTENYQEA